MPAIRALLSEAVRIAEEQAAVYDLAYLLAAEDVA